MLDHQKEAIRTMRELGKGYKDIARSLGLKLHTVRDYCRYHGLTGNARVNILTYLKPSAMSVQQPQNLCRNCGGPADLPKPGKSKGRARKFCDDSCRYEYWNKVRSGKM